MKKLMLTTLFLLTSTLTYAEKANTTATTPPSVISTKSQNVNQNVNENAQNTVQAATPANQSHSVAAQTKRSMRSYLKNNKSNHYRLNSHKGKNLINPSKNNQTNPPSTAQKPQTDKPAPKAVSENKTQPETLTHTKDANKDGRANVAAAKTEANKEINKENKEVKQNLTANKVEASKEARQNVAPTKTETSKDNSKENKDVRQNAIAKVEAAKKAVEQQHATKADSKENHQAADKKENKDEKTGVLIQAGAFRNDALAESQLAKVSLLGMPAKVVKLKDANGNVIRVVRSRERWNQAEAEKVMGRLEQHNVQTLLLSY